MIIFCSLMQYKYNYYHLA